MAVRVTQHVVEMILPRLTYSPTTPTGVGVSQHVLEAIIAPNAGGGSVWVTQHVVEAIMAPPNDQQHGATTTPPETSSVFGG